MTNVGYVEAPVIALGELTPSERAAKAAVSTRQWQAAVRRFVIARHASVVPADWSMSARLAHLQRAMDAGMLPPGALPAKEQLRQLVHRWQTGDRSISAFLDGRRRSGVRARPLHPELRRVVDAAVLTGTPSTGAGVHHALAARARALAAEEGVLPWVPSTATVKQLVGRGRRLERSAARHGAAAAEIDALPHSTVPATVAHAVWTLDEHTSRRWCGAFDHTAPNGGAWVSFRPDVVLVEDNASRAIVGYWVVDPTTRIGADGRMKLGGFDTDDVLAALLSAALPPLGTAATRPFAGHLPHEQLRWDNAKAHLAINARLKEIGLEPPQLPPHRPINRGIVERLGGTLKAWDEQGLGYDGTFVPTDRVVQDEREAQATAAATTARRAARTEIAPIDLPRIDEFRRDVERLVYRYNYEHVHRSLNGRTPAQAFQALYPRRGTPEAKGMRTGNDLLALLPVETTVVTTHGAVHRGTRYAYTIDRAMLMVGTPLTVRADPKGRGLLLEHTSGLVLLPPLVLWAKGQTPEQVAETQLGAATTTEAKARAARAEREAALVGALWLGRAADAAREARAGVGAAEADDAPPQRPTAARATTGPADPAFDPTNFALPETEQPIASSTSSTERRSAHG